MSAVLKAHEPSARYLTTVEPTLIEHFELLARSSTGIRHLRELVLAFALEGRLLPQNPKDETAGLLLGRIHDHKAACFVGGKRKAVSAQDTDSDQDVPYRAPQGWVWTTLAGIGLINPRNEANDDVMASFVQMSSIPTALSDAHVSEPRLWKDIKSGFTHFAEGDVGVAKITPCFENGKSTVFERLDNGIGGGTTELHIVRPLCGIKPRYVLIFLKSPRFLRNGEAVMTGTAGQKRLPRSYFENCPFPLPPLAEQARIVARVDELMRLCDTLEAKGRLEAEQHARLLGTLLGTLTDSTTPEELAANWQRVAAHFDLLLDRPEAVDALEQTILQLAVRGLLVPHAKAMADFDAAAAVGEEGLFETPQSWKWRRIDDVATVQGGIQKTPARTPIKHHVPYLRVANVQRDHLDLNEIERFEVAPDEAERWGLRAGDLLIVEGNGSEHEIGRCAVWTGAIDPCVYQNHLIRVRCNEPAFVSFLQLFLNSPDGKAEMKRLAITTSGLYNLSVGKIRRFLVPLPPSEEQARIVARVTELRRLCTTLRQRLAAQQTVQSHLADALVEQALA